MNTLRFCRPTLALAGALAFFSCAGIAATANAQTDEVSLARGAEPDTTPQQRYHSAIREAGGGLKVSLQECKGLEAAGRRSCEVQARTLYKRDMAKAKQMIRDPSVRPIDVMGGPIRTTESTYEIRK